MYLGNQPITGENNNFKILDDILSYTETFNGSSASVVSVADDTLTFVSHRFITGQRVTYSTTGTAIGGLVISTAYFVIKNDQNTIKLASTFANANNNVAINLTALGTGTTHTLIVAFDSINTKFKASFDNGTKALITRAAQLQISINGVIQQPQDTTSPTNGFGIDLDGVIIFSTAPANTDIFWGNVFANNFATFDISDNTVDSFTGNGSLVNFTLSKIPANNQNLLVTIDGVVQYPSDNTTIRAYGLSENILTFVGAPGNATAIQVRHIGFAGATSSSVTGFYGRTGNVGLTTADTVNVGNIIVSGISTLGITTTTNLTAQSLIVSGISTLGTVVVGGGTTQLIVTGNARITGILTVGTGSITLNGSTNIINVGTGVTLSSSAINVSGIITATSIVVSAGTTALPSISPSGDSNTGVFFPDADTIAFSEGGVEAVRIDPNGNVKVGSKDNSNAGMLYITVGNVGVTDGGIQLWGRTNGSSFVQFGDTTTSADQYRGYLAYDHASDFLSLGTASLERVRIDSSGRLLVGTSSARSNFFNSSATAQVQIEGTDADKSAIASINVANNAGGARIYLAKGRGGSLGSNTVVQNSDTLGVITFQGNDGTEFVSGAEIEAFVDEAPGANDLPTALKFSTTADGASSPTERLRIKNTGQSYFQTTADTDLIYALSGNASYTSATIAFATTRAAGTLCNYLFGTANSVNTFLVRNNGDVRNTNGTYTTISDIRLKENIVDAASQWDDIKAIKVRNWNFKEETGYETHRQIGPIAQELEAVCPGLVSESPDRDVDGNDLGTTTKSVNQSVLYMKAVKALQEAMERIETLEASNADMLARMTALEAA